MRRTFSMSPGRESQRMSQWRTHTTTATLLASISALAPLPSSGETSARITGCLTSGGTLVKLAVGEAPRIPCSNTETKVSLLTSSETSPSACLWVVDSAGAKVGSVVDQHPGQSPTGVAAALEVDERPAIFYVDRRDQQAPLSGTAYIANTLYFLSSDCSGPALLPIDVDEILDATTFNPPGKTLYIAATASTLESTEVQSARLLSGECVEAEITLYTAPAMSSGLDFATFSPPFSVTYRDCADN